MDPIAFLTSAVGTLIAVVVGILAIIALAVLIGPLLFPVAIAALVFIQLREDSKNGH